MKQLVVAMTVVIGLAASSAWANRTDVVYLKNGDRITCSVKQLERGRLRVTTNSMGTVFIAWIDVRSVETSKIFVVTLEDGRLVSGDLAPSGSDGNLNVRADEELIDIPLDSIVDLTEIRRGFLKRIDGSVDLGFNFQKANNDVNYSLQAEVVHSTKQSDTNVDLRSILSSRNDAPRAFRSVLSLTHVHYFQGKWQAVGLGRVEQNDELGLDLRTNLGAAAARTIIDTNKNRLRILGGLTTNREQYALERESLSSLEALISTSYDFFVYGDLGADVVANLSLYPSLTESGRYRIEFDGRYRHEIFTDFFVSLSGWYSFDNQAPLIGGETVRQEDYGLVTSLGWAF